MSQGPYSTADRPRLLIVDDEPRNLRLLADIFADDYQLSLATSGSKALELLEATPGIELVLLDVMMPQIDGHEVFRTMRERPNSRDIPVIFITARSDADSEILALGGGAADYLHKPVHVGLARTRVRQQITLARQRRELRLAREAADAGSRAKSQFLTGVSHELRTPLNAILGFSQVLQLDPALTPVQRSSVQEIHEAGQHLLSLINDVLDLGKIEAAKLEVLQETINLDELALSCARLCEPLARRQSISVSVEPEPGTRALAWADRTRVRQVLVNLLSNAIKYNQTGGHVWLRLRSRPGGRVEVSVQDDGPGMEPALQQRLFEPFLRAAENERRQLEGTGIGLTICKRLVELMGGEIGFTSELGRGTRFWFTLPMQRMENVSAESAATIEIVRSPELDPADPGPQGPAQAVARKVLCVDDNPSNLKLLEIVLRRVPGVTVVSTTDPLRALALALEHRPHLILLDIQMPVVDGYEVLRRLRSVPALSATPVAALSANAMLEDILEGRAAGFADYFTKPFDVPELLGAVRALLENRHQPRAVSTEPSRG